MIQILEVNCATPALGAALSAFKRIISLIQIIVPIMLMIGLMIHIMNLMKNPDDAKLKKKITNSVHAAVIVFFIPVFINVVMGMLGENYSFSSCWNHINDPGTTTSYVDPYAGQKKNIFVSNPSDYEQGQKKANNNNSGTGGNTSTGGYDGEAIEGTAQKVGDVVWDSRDVTKISNLTSTQLIAILNAHGGKAKNFIPYAQALITTEQKYSVNVFFLLGVQALESGWATSRIFRNCNNLGGVRESKAHPSNGCGRNAGGGFAYFNTVQEFIDYHGNLLHNKYLTPGGPYYEGKSPYDVVKHYCPGCSSWPKSVISIANSLFKHVSEVIK